MALRLLDFSRGDPKTLLSRLAAHADSACKLLNADPALVWAAGSDPQGPIDVQLRGSRGESLLISAGAGSGAGPALGLTLIGERGIASWEPDAAEAASQAAAGPELSARGQQLHEAIVQCLQTGDATVLGNKQPASSSPQIQKFPAADKPSARPTAPVRPPLGVLLVSGGQTHQEMYAPAFAADPRCRLIGLSDEHDVPVRRRALNGQLAQSLGIPILEDLDEALSRADVHIVSICAEPERRARLIERAAAAGKHVYLDKPLAASIEEAGRIQERVHGAGVFSQMFSLVHSPAARRIRAELESGRLGTLVAVHCDLCFAKGPAGTAELGRPRREDPQPKRFETIEAKRELVNIGVYPLAMLWWLLGRPVRRVFATTANYFFAEHQRNDMEDFAQVWLELEGGVAATLCVGRTGWRSHPAGGLQRTWLVGTHGTACIDAYRPRLEVWADEPAWQEPRRHPEDPMGFWTSTQLAAGVAPKTAWIAPADEHADVRHFVDCVVAGHDSDLPAQGAAEVLAALLAAYRSAADGRPVEIVRRA